MLTTPTISRSNRKTNIFAYLTHNQTQKYTATNLIFLPTHTPWHLLNKKKKCTETETETKNWQLLLEESREWVGLEWFGDDAGDDDDDVVFRDAGGDGEMNVTIKWISNEMISIQWL